MGPATQHFPPHQFAVFETAAGFCSIELEGVQVAPPPPVQQSVGL